jgi:hypothetical protein
VRGLEPLGLDPHLVPEHLADIMNRQIPQSLVDEVASIYEDMSRRQVADRKDSVSIIGETHIFFPEDDDEDDNGE